MTLDSSTVSIMTEVLLASNRENRGRPNVSIWFSRALLDDDISWEDQRGDFVCLLKNVEQTNGIQLADCIEKSLIYLGYKVLRDATVIPIRDGYEEDYI
jgi:hypothetical protein